MVALRAHMRILGDKDLAFEWLTKAFDTHGAYIVMANASPMFDVFKGDPRFDALIARLHLPDMIRSCSALSC